MIDPYYAEWVVAAHEERLLAAARRERLLREARAARRHRPSPRHPAPAAALAALGSLLVALGWRLQRLAAEDVDLPLGASTRAPLSA